MIKKKLCATLLGILFLLPNICAPSTAFATDTMSVRAKMDAYISFLSEYGSAYWNGNYRGNTSTKDLRIAINSNELSYGLTTGGCVKKDSNGSHLYSNGCTSNIFAGAAQCFGFAKYFCYYLYGSYPQYASGNSIIAGYQKDSEWMYYHRGMGTSACPELQTGDFIRYYPNDSTVHAAIVYSVNSDSNTINVIDCGNGNCQIRKHNLSVTYSQFKGYYQNGKAYVCRYTALSGSASNGENSNISGNNCYTGYVKGTNGALVINSRAASGYQIGRIPESASCKVYPIKSVGMWYYVEYNGVSGYSYGKYISKTAPAELVNPTAPTIELPDSPQIKVDRTTINQGESVTVSWSKDANATEYAVVVTNISTGAKEEYPTTSTQLKLTDLDVGIYDITAYAGNSAVTVPSGNVVHLEVKESEPSAKAPAAPRLQISSTLISVGAEVTASWSKEADATKYTIVITNSQTGRSEEKNTTDTRMVLSGLDVGVYQIQVFSENGSMHSDLSDLIQLVVAEKEVLPGKPVIRLSANTINAGENITISWDADVNASKFEVTYISNMTLNSDTTTRTFYTLSELSAGTYRFTVTAINGSSRVSSDTVTLTVNPQKILPKKPVVKLSSSTIAEGGNITVSWDSDANTEWFFLYYGSSFQQLSDNYSTLSNLAAGTYTIYVEADNQNGSTVSDSVILTVTPVTDTELTTTGYVLGTNGALAINSIAASGNQIGRIPEGESFIIYTGRTSGNWYYVEYNGVKGYAYKTYITTSQPTTRTGIISGTNGALAINSTAASGNQIGRIPEGASCTVFTGRTNGNWYWVKYNGVSGYAYSKYITLQ